MHPYQKNLLILISSVAIIIASVVFLLKNQPDQFAQALPANTEAYLFTQTKYLKNLPHKDLLYTWLGQNSDLTAKAWQNILEQKVLNSVGIFYTNNKSFGIITNNQTNRNLLEQQKFSFTLSDQFLIFPKASFEARPSKLVNELWYKKLHKNINFAKLTILFKNPTIIYPALLNDFDLKEPILVSGNYKGQQLKLSITGNIGLPKVKAETPNLLFLPTDTQMYASNLSWLNLDKRNTNGKDISLNLVQDLNGPFEYLKTLDNFYLYLPKESNSIDLVQATIKSAFANLYPSQKEVTLPDGTTGIHLVADPNQFSFKSTNNISQLSVDSQNIYLINLANNYLISSAPAKTVPGELNINEKVSNCSKFNNKSFVFANISGQSLVAINKSLDQVFICID